MKTIRDTDKNFEEEKAKMFNPMNKEEQLRLVFRTILEKSFTDDYIFREYINRMNFDKLVNRLIMEVKIRVYLGG